jgi:pantoate--beta-alanine ligase
LEPDQRRRATSLSRALRAAQTAAEAGETRTEAVLDAARAELERSGVEPDYLEARDAESLAPAESLNGRPVLVAVAARFGRARLIDNLVIGG